MRRLLLFTLLVAGLPAFGQTTTYTGTIKDLTGAAVTSGRISFTLSPPGVSNISGTGSFVSTTVSCLINGSGAPVSSVDGTSPCVVVNNTSLTPTGTSYKICIQPYNVTPGSCLNAFALGGSVDISTLVPTPATQPNYGVGAANGIAPLDSTSKVPLANLPATFTSGIVNATLFTGSDIGAQINAANAAMSSSGGVLYVPQSATCYSFSTPIVITKPITLMGGAVGTCLQFTAGGTAITFSSIGSGLYPGSNAWGTGLRDINLVGNGSGTGVYLNGIAGFKADAANVYSFSTGLTFGNNTYVANWINSAFRNNATAVLYPNNLSNSGENFSFVNDAFTNGTQTDGTSTGLSCVNLLPGTPAQNVEMSFVNSNFDDCQVLIGGNTMQVRFINPHFEDPGSSTLDFPFVKITSTSSSTPSLVSMVSPTFFVDSPTVTMSSYIEVNNYSQLTVSGGAKAFGFGGTSAPPVAFALKGIGQAFLTVNGTLTGNIGAYTPTFFPPVWSTDGTNNPIIHQPIPSQTATLAVSNAGGNFVLAQPIDGNISGILSLTYTGTSRDHRMILAVDVGAFSTNGTLSVLSNYALGGNLVITPSLKNNGTLEQIVLAVANQGGNAGVITAQWIGEGKFESTLFPPGATPYGSANTSFGLSVGIDGVVNASGYKVGTSAAPIFSGTPTVGQAACWKSTGVVGYCSTTPTSGTCTCN